MKDKDQPLLISIFLTFVFACVIAICITAYQIAKLFA